MQREKKEKIKWKMKNGMKDARTWHDISAKLGVSGEKRKMWGCNKHHLSLPGLEERKIPLNSFDNAMTIAWWCSRITAVGLQHITKEQCECIYSVWTLMQTLLFFVSMGEFAHAADLICSSDWVETLLNSSSTFWSHPKVIWFLHVKVFSSLISS